MTAALTQRPGSVLARRPLHFFVLADCSGSMAAHGKIQALNTALCEAIPHLVDVADHNPHADILVRVITFATGARWHVERPTPVRDLQWTDLESGGFTDLGAALDLLVEELRPARMPERALPPAMVLVSDGMPTDEYEASLAALLAEPWGQRASRIAVGIGRDAQPEMLQEFMGRDGGAPLRANNPEQLVRSIRLATSHASRVATNLPPGLPASSVPVPADPSADGTGDIW